MYLTTLLFLSLTFSLLPSLHYFLYITNCLSYLLSLASVSRAMIFLSPHNLSSLYTSIYYFTPLSTTSCLHHHPSQTALISSTSATTTTATTTNNNNNTRTQHHLYQQKQHPPPHRLYFPNHSHVSPFPTLAVTPLPSPPQPSPPPTSMIVFLFFTRV